MKLNLGCGNQIKEGFVNLDIEKNEGVDIVHDLDVMPWPFKDNSVSYIYAKDILEHLNDIYPAMAEIHRILRPGGKIYIEVPFCRSFDAIENPTHKHLFGERTFDFFTENGLNKPSFSSPFKFRLIRKNLEVNSMITDSPLLRPIMLIPKGILKRFVFDVYNKMTVELEIVK